MRRLLPLLGIALALATAAPPARAACGPDRFTVVGRVLDPVGGPLDGVPCCLLLVSLTQRTGPPPHASHDVIVRSRADGTFEACLPCAPPDELFQVSVSATCCGRLVRPLDLFSCIDPATGQPRVVDVGDVGCASAPDTGSTSLTGSVSCRTGPLLEPVADCGVHWIAAGGPYGHVWTDAFGEWEACVPCLGATDTTFALTSECCLEESFVTIPACSERHSADPVTCTPCPAPTCPAPRHVELSGHVLCTLDLDGDTLGDPMAGCRVRLSFPDNIFACLPRDVSPADQFAVTDVSGAWSACVPCPALPDCGEWIVTATSECCAAERSRFVIGCADTILPTLVCPAPSGRDCVAPCANGSTQVRGRITCTDPVTGDPRPVAGCTIRVQPVGCGPLVSVVTDANGEYSTCVSCAACNSVEVTAECCGASVIRNVTCVNDTIADLTCGSCAGMPDPCDPLRTIEGFVSCRDAAGLPLAIPGCRVRVECPSGATFGAVTGPDGRYSACVPCCSELRVTPECCPDGTRDVVVPGCGSVVVDLPCPRPCGVPRTCPPPSAIQVTGVVACTSPGSAPPIAGCEVTLVARDAAAIVSEVVATTDGSGRYVACLPCVRDVEEVTAVAECCGGTASVLLPSAGCPDTLTLPAVDCGTCSPCPADMTRYQGHVRCRSGGGMPACRVRLTISTCRGDLDVETVTDRNGQYRACAPCPCPGATVRVLALCCGATRVERVARCGPVTPIPALTCPAPCP